MDLTTVSRSEIGRYLGIRNGKADVKTASLIEACLLELNGKCSERHVFRTFPLSFLKEDGEGDAPVIDFGCFRVHSTSLYRNLEGCEEALLFAATIGDGADLLIRRYEKTAMAKAAVCQAAAAAMIEAYCDALNDAWREEYAAKGMALRPRFSCGYGDFALAHQTDFMNVLAMDKRIGVRLTDTLLMVPTKSVTAVIGIYRETPASS